MCRYKVFEVNGLDETLTDTGKVIECIPAYCSDAAAMVLELYGFKSQWNGSYAAIVAANNSDIEITYNYLLYGVRNTWVLKKDV